MSFSAYKHRVLSFTDGTTIHKANNVLHVVLNRLHNYLDFLHNQDHSNAALEKVHIDKALLILSMLTGIEEMQAEDFI